MLEQSLALRTLIIDDESDCVGVAQKLIAAHCPELLRAGIYDKRRDVFGHQIPSRIGRNP